MSVGRPRPDLIARCLPIAGAADRAVFGLSTYKICTTQNTLKLDDGFKVSPSTVSLDRMQLTSYCRAFQAVTHRVGHRLLWALIMCRPQLPELTFQVSFAGLGFLACYLAGKMHLWDKRGHRVSRTLLHRCTSDLCCRRRPGRRVMRRLTLHPRLERGGLWPRFSGG